MKQFCYFCEEKDCKISLADATDSGKEWDEDIDGELTDCEMIRQYKILKSYARHKQSINARSSFVL